MSPKIFYRQKFFFITLLLCILIQPAFSANVLARPRKMFALKSEHFEIIFPESCEDTAKLLYSSADGLFAQAERQLADELELSIDSSLFMPVIISPDSDELEVKYTASPYNRIIIFDSPKNSETSVFSDSLLSLFYHQIYLALLQTTRSPFNQFVSKWLAGDSYQPVSLFNLPYSFVEGAAFLAEGINSDAGRRMDDGYFLQILSQAKLEGKFPGWFQVSAVIDVYPGETLALAAGSGFAAFLLSTYGLEKYSELWNECGKLNPMVTQGIFRKVYGETLEDLWKSFEESVPLPENLIAADIEESKIEQLFPWDKEANYEHILLSDYGFVWYDRLRHEVDIYDENSLVKIRQLLFLADNVERMSLSPDGRLLSVSNTQARTMEDLSESYTWIYDLKERKFLKVKVPLRDAVIVQTVDGLYAVAGVNIREPEPQIQIYSFSIEKGTPVLIFNKGYDRNSVPFSPVYAGNGELVYILDQGAVQKICRLNFGEENVSEKNYVISGDKKIRIRNLNYQRTEKCFTFEYADSVAHSFTRAGIISQNLEHATFFTEDFSGGMHNPLVSGNQLFYGAKKFSSTKLCSVRLDDLKKKEAPLVLLEKALSENEPVHEASVSETDFAVQKTKLYNPFKYMADFSYTPFFPIKLMDLDDGILYWPGLGISVGTQTDPCMNTQAVFAAGWNYIPLDFSWTSNIPSSYLARLRYASVETDKDKSAAFYIENSSTPVYLKAGALFNFNMNGEYDLKFLAGSQWKIPLGIALRTLNFNIQSTYNISTDYYDKTLADSHPSLSDWPSFKDAYEIVEVSTAIEYSNIHQSGWSPFEQRGLSLGARIFSMWDMYEVRLLRKAREEERKAQEEALKVLQNNQENESKKSNDKLTKAQKKNLFSDSIMDITQLNVGVFGTIAIPRLTPFTYWHGWILSAPAKISAEFMNKAGTALEARGQVLLFGKEIHNGFRPLYLYFRRVGLTVGYDMSLNYNTSEVRLPDIRHENYLAEVFSDVYYSDAVFLILNLDFNIAAGRPSAVPINTTLMGTYFPDTKGYAVTLDFRFRL